MQPFQIFRPGKHTAANGMALEFGEEMLKKAAVAYDPAIHEAPIVVGHPKDNGPAYGWVKSLNFDESGNIVAEPDQIDPAFAELVEAGRYKKRSASWYLPDSPSNPVPGTLYLRHVGFLGAQPPALKGLKDVSFSEEEGVVEFSDPMLVSSLFRRLREFLLAKFTPEDADRVVPDWMVQDLEAEARAPITENAPPATAQAMPNFSEENEMSLTPEQIKALQDENAQLKVKVGQAADFSEKAADIAKREQALAKKEIGTEIDALITAGKVLPAQKAGLCEFMASLSDGETVVEFGEGDQAKKVSPRQFMRDYLAGMPKIVDFNEQSREDKPNGADLEGQELANKAVEYKESMRSKGVEITVTEAVAAVRAGKATV